MALLIAFGLMNVIAMAVLAAAVLAEKTWVWGPQVSRVLGIAALGLAVAVVFVPGLAPGLQHVGNTGQMGGMWRGCRAGGASYGYAVTRGARARRVVNGAQPRPNGRWMR